MTFSFKIDETEKSLLKYLLNFGENVSTYTQDCSRLTEGDFLTGKIKKEHLRELQEFKKIILGVRESKNTIKLEVTDGKSLYSFIKTNNVVMQLQGKIPSNLLDFEYESFRIPDAQPSLSMIKFCDNDMSFKSNLKETLRTLLENKGDCLDYFVPIVQKCDETLNV